jgi:hypothetical protein
MDWLRFFLIGWGQSLSIYAALQTGALLTVRGQWRIAAATPLPLMVLVSAHMAWAYSQGSNLWPMTMLMTAPSAALAVLLIWVAALLSSHRARMTIVPVGLVIGAVLVAIVSPPGIDVLWVRKGTIVLTAVLVTLGAAVSHVTWIIRSKGRITTS